MHVSVWGVSALWEQTAKEKMSKLCPAILKTTLWRLDVMTFSTLHEQSIMRNTQYVGMAFLINRGLCWAHQQQVHHHGDILQSFFMDVLNLKPWKSPKAYIQSQYCHIMLETAMDFWRFHNEKQEMDFNISNSHFYVHSLCNTHKKENRRKENIS